jgi:hypothetical protein
VYQKRGVFVIDNATDGFTLYRLEGEGQPVRTFATAPPSISVPKQVAFGEEGKVVMGGSDNGLVYIFDRKTLETLHHADIGLVQTIAVRLRLVTKNVTELVFRRAISTAAARLPVLRLR